MSINKIVGGLYQLKASIEINESNQARFCFIRDDVIYNKSYWKERFSLTSDTLPLMLIKPELNLTPKTAAASWAPAAAAAADSISTSILNHSSDYNLARDQWDDNKCIPGSVFVTPDGQLIWMSDIDFKYFEEVRF